MSYLFIIKVEDMWRLEDINNICSHSCIILKERQFYSIKACMCGNKRFVLPLVHLRLYAKFAHLPIVALQCAKYKLAIIYIYIYIFILPKALYRNSTRPCAELQKFSELLLVHFVHNLPVPDNYLVLRIIDSLVLCVI